MNAAPYKLALYHFSTCPFCLRVRAAMKMMGVHVPLKDARGDDEARRELLEGGGRTQVPCLRIEDPEGHVDWLYESADIIHWLKENVA